MRAVQRGFGRTVAIVALTLALEGIIAEASESETSHQGGVKTRNGVMVLDLGRGGNWYDKASECRSAYRDFEEPGHRFELTGFRVAYGP
jgi:formylglycine-generating enzyme required for sulfatase activity